MNGDDEEDRLLGAEVLEQYIDENYASVNAFALEHGFNQSELSKLLNGKRTRISVDMAVALRTATRGVVTVEMWVTE